MTTEFAEFAKRYTDNPIIDWAVGQKQVTEIVWGRAMLTAIYAGPVAYPDKITMALKMQSPLYGPVRVKPIRSELSDRSLSVPNTLGKSITGHYYIIEFSNPVTELSCAYRPVFSLEKAGAAEGAGIATASYKKQYEVMPCCNATDTAYFAVNDPNNDWRVSMGSSVVWRFPKLSSG